MDGPVAEALTEAMNLGRRTHSDAAAEHHAAFANSVAYAVTGWSGGYGGPSMREHAASRHLHNLGLRPGSISFDDAVKLVEEICYGPLTLAIAQMLEVEYCFDDPASEQEEALRLLQK